MLSPDCFFSEGGAMDDDDMDFLFLMPLDDRGEPVDDDDDDDDVATETVALMAVALVLLVVMERRID